MENSAALAITAAGTPDEFLAAQRLASAMLPPSRLRAMLEAADGSPLKALELGDALSHPPIALTVKQRERLDMARKAPTPTLLINQAAALGAGVVLYYESAYPVLLREASDAPPLLFVRGTLPDGESAAAAIVGSRRAMLYGREQAVRFARAFAENGIVVVSGGATGIDTSAHQGAVDAGGATIVVLGCGVDVAYPAANRALFQQIAERGGAVISEFAMGVTPEPWHFPTRNRIIAAIARITLVIESPADSGAMITARNAGEYGRDVWAIPGEIGTGRSRGCHKLIQDGAGLADSPADVLAMFGVGESAGEGFGVRASGFGRREAEAEEKALPFPNAEARTPKPAVVSLSPDEETLLAQLDETPRHLDVVGVAAGLGTPQASVAATMLEMKGLIERRPGNLFVRRA